MRVFVAPHTVAVSAAAFVLALIGALSFPFSLSHAAVPDAAGPGAAGPGAAGPGALPRPPAKAAPAGRSSPVKPAGPNRAVVVLLDKSGSTLENGILDEEKRAAVAALNALQPDELFSGIAFDNAPFVILPLAPAGELKPIAPARLERILPAGRTNLVAGLKASAEMLGRKEARAKHIILISDAKVPLEPDELTEVINSFRAAKISLSTISIGKEGDVQLLRLLARYGHGTFFEATDPKSATEHVLHDLTIFSDVASKSAAAAAARRKMAEAAVRGK